MRWDGVGAWEFGCGRAVELPVLFFLCAEEILAVPLLTY